MWNGRWLNKDVIQNVQRKYYFQQDGHLRFNTSDTEFWLAFIPIESSFIVIKLVS